MYVYNTELSDWITERKMRRGKKRKNEEREKYKKEEIQWVKRELSRTNLGRVQDPPGCNLDVSIVTWTRTVLRWSNDQRSHTSSSLSRAPAPRPSWMWPVMKNGKLVSGRESSSWVKKGVRVRRWRRAMIRIYRGTDHDNDGLAEVSSAGGRTIDDPSNRSPSRWSRALSRIPDGK